jgi:hypothetical protein
MKPDHEHKWIFDKVTCCYVLKCGSCQRSTTVHYWNGDKPMPGDNVKILEDGDTMELDLIK